MHSLVLVVLQLCFAVVTCSRYQVSGHQNQKQLIQLKSQFDINPGGFQSLNIKVTPEHLSINGHMPPKLVSIASLNNNGIYGDGDLVVLTLEYATTVNVSGTPSLTLNTGCTSDECVTKEIQSFRCAADKGSFAMKLENQYVMSIASNTTQDQLKNKLETFDGINEVTVHYSEIKSGNTLRNEICTSEGNDIMITFEDISFPQYDGDLPLIELDSYNWFNDPRTLRPQGNVEERLKGIHNEYVVELPVSTTEVQKGKNQRNSEAYYVSGAGTNVLLFHYNVRVGDSAPALDVISINFDNGYVFSPITGANVSTAIPPLGKSYRYIDSSPSSLSYNQDLTITSSVPKVLAVTSPNENSIYTRGDSILLHVEFDIPVKYYGTDIYLLLKPGLLFRQAYIQGLSDDLKTMIFQYDVSAGDFSDDLDYRGVDSLVLNGGSIYRFSEGNLSVADLTLPTPGQEGSLSVLKDIVIDTNSPLVLDFEMASPVETYTAGDEIDLLVRFDFPVQVIGTPIIWVRNEVRELNNARIRYAPLGQVSQYAPTAPGDVSTITFQFVFNWELQRNDKIVIVLPSFTGADNGNVYFGSSGLGALFSGKWQESTETLTLTLQNNTLAAFTEIVLEVEAGSSIALSPHGVMSASNDMYYRVVSQKFNTTSLSFLDVDDIMFSSLALEISPATTEAQVGLLLKFTVPNVLVEGDVLTLHMPNFVLLTGANNEASSTFFDFSWDKNHTNLVLTVNSNSSSLLFEVSLDAYIPLILPKQGIGSESVHISADFRNSGQVQNTAVPVITQVCSDPEASVVYKTNHPGHASAIQFDFTIGLHKILVGDQVTFTLPWNSNPINNPVDGDVTTFLSGTDASMWTATVTNDVIVLTAVSDIAALASVSFLLSDAAGLVVPVYGVQKNNQTFSFHLNSPQCMMTSPIVYYFTEWVLSVSASANFTSPVITNSPVGIDINILISDDLVAGDVVYVTMPDYFRSESADPYDNITVSSVAVSARYNRLYRRMEFTLLAPYSPVLSDPLSISIPESPGFHLPSGGLQLNDHSISLSIYSEHGKIENVDVQNPCIGFCQVDATYSVVITHEPVTLEFTTYFSEEMFTNEEIVLSFDGMSKDAVANIGVYIAPASMSGNTAVTTWDSSLNAIVVVLPTFNALTFPFSTKSTLPKNEFLTFTVTGLEFTSTSGRGTVSRTGSRAHINGTISTEIPFPDIVYMGPDISTAFMSFDLSANDNIDPTLSANLTVGFFLQQDLLIGASISIQLPSFDFNDTDLVDFVNILDHDFSHTIDGGNKIIRLTALTLISGQQAIEFTFDKIVLPYIGVDDNSTIVKYAVGFGDVMSDQVYFTEVKGVKVVRDAVATVSSYQNPGLHIKDSIKIEWWSNFEITSGATIVVQIPGLTSAAAMPTLTTSASMIPRFFTSNTTFLFTATSTINAGLVSLDVVANTTNESLQVVVAGMQASQLGSLTVRQFFHDQSVYPAAIVTLPCVGICDAFLSADVGKSSYSTAYTLVLTFSDPLSYLDEISLYLEGFTKDSEEPVDIPHDDLILIGTWNISTSVFSILVGNYTNGMMEVTNLNLELSRDILLRLPDTGISSEANMFNMTWTSSAILETISGSLLEIKPVSNLIVSSLEISPRRAGVVADFRLTLSFSNELTPGDIIDVSFPDYGFPDGSMSLSGRDSGTFEAEGLTANVLSGIATLLLTCTQAQPVGAELQVEFGGVELPYDGVHESSIRTVVSVVSTAKAAMSSQSILNYTRIGALRNSFVNLESNRSSDVIVFQVGFDVKCAIEIGGVLELVLPSVESDVDHVVDVDFNGCSDCLSATWQSSSGSLLVTINYNMTVGSTNFTFSSSQLRMGSVVFYPDNVNGMLLYSVQSDLCYIDQTAVDFSAAVGFYSSTISFGNPRAGMTSSIIFSFTPVDFMTVGDVLVVALPGFGVTTGASVNTPAMLDITENVVVGNLTWVYDISTGSPYLEITIPIVTHIKSLETIDIEISSSNLLILPSEGIRAISSNISVTKKYPKYSRNMTGTFSTVQPVGYFLTKSVRVTSLLPGDVIPLDLEFALTGDIDVAETVSFYLPDFTKGTNDLWLSGNYSGYFSVTWEPSSSMLMLTALQLVVAESPVTITVNNLRTPADGVSEVESLLYSVSSTSVEAPVISDTLQYMSLIPSASTSSIRFNAAQSSSLTYMPDGSVGNRSILLMPGHELNDEDVGTTVTIENTLYTIQDVDSDVITFEEVYSSVLVTQASPEIKLFTPDARAAYYLNGSLTNELTFRYRVKRGDVSNGLDIHNTTSSIHTSEPFQLLGSDQVLRVSQVPLVPFSQILPSFDGGSEVTIDSVRPTVVRIDSSSPDGTYTAGQLIDFRITFSHEVMVNLLPGQSPALLLRKSNGDIAIARYFSGIDTNQLSFAYTIKTDDYEYLNSDLITVDKSFSLIQPLRVIMSNKFQYIRRSAQYPVIDVYPNIPLSGLNVSSNISWVGDGVYVTSVVAVPSEAHEDFVYSAGDVVYVNVTFSDNVRVNFGSDVVEVSQQLKIMLNVGKSSGLPGHATFVNVSDSNSLIFAYTISIEDTLSSADSALLLACTCQDLYDRTFLELYNGTTIVEAASRGHLVSTILASNNAPTSLLLLSPYFIENTAPFVQSVSSNVTVGVYSPGAAILISVHFDRRVSSMGMTRLFLVGDNREHCVAHLFSGNNTASLNYLYVATQQSRTSAMSCRYLNALDTTYGNVLRYSESPVFPATLEFPLPGSGDSVGIKTKVTIDSTDVYMNQMSARTSMDEVGQHITVHPLIDLYVRASEDEIIHLVYLYDQEPGPKVIEFDTPEDTVRADIQLFVENGLDFSAITSYGSLYRSIFIRDSALMPFLFAPEVSSTDRDQSIFFSKKHWWSDYDISNTLEFIMKYDRRVTGDGLYLPLNLGSTLNYAKAGKETRQWLVTIDLRDLSDGEDDINQHQFQIRYGGWTSSCISVGGALDGVMSLQAKLEMIPALRRLGFTVKRQISDPNFHTFLVESKRPASHDLVLANSFSSCLYPIERSRMGIAGSGNLNMQYNVRAYGSVVLQPNSTVSPGTYDFTVQGHSGLHLSDQGMENQDFIFEHFDDMGTPISRRSVSSKNFPRVGSSTLILSATVPESATFVHTAVSMDIPLTVNDELTVYLPGIVSTSSNVLSGVIVGCCSVVWRNENATLTFTFNSAFEAYELIDLSIDNDFGLFLPSYGLLDRESFQFSVVAQQGVIPRTVFQTMKGLPISHVGIVVKSPVPRFFSDIVIEFTTGVMIDADASIIFTLPDYRIADDRWTDHSSEISRQVALGLYPVRINVSMETSLDLSGPFEHAFTGAFLNSSQLAIRPIYPMQPGTYTVTILDSSRIIVGTPSTFPMNEPPLVSVVGLSWNMSETVVRNFTEVMGLIDSNIEILVDRPSEVVTNFTFSFQVTYDIMGPIEIELHISKLTNILRQQVWQVDDNTTLTWNELSQSFLYSSGYGISNTTGFCLALSAANMSNFRVTGEGIKFVNEYHGADIKDTKQFVQFSVWSPNVFMPMVPIHSITTIPAVVSSSIAFSTDIFSEKPTDITIDLFLNMKASLGDSFYITLYEVDTVTTDVSVSLTGASGGFSSYEYFFSNDTFKITIENRTGCCDDDDQTHYQWIVPAEFGLYRSRGVVQVGSPVYTVNWENVYFDTGNVPFDSYPLTPFAMTVISFELPYVDTVSPMTIKFITTTDVLKNDVIVFVLTAYSFNIGDVGSESSLSDGDGNIWAVSWSASTESLSLTVPKNYPQMSFEFNFSDTLAPTLPSLTSLPFSSQEVYVTRNSDSLIPQAVKRVQSIGGMDVNSSSIVFKIPDAEIVEVSVVLQLAKPLDIGDVVSVILSNFEFSFDVSLQVFDLDVASPETFSDEVSVDYKAKMDKKSKSLMIETLSRNVDRHNISLMVRSEASSLKLLTSECLQNRNSSTCPVFVAIESFSCAVPNTLVSSQYVKPFEYATLRLSDGTVGITPRYESTSMPSYNTATTSEGGYPTSIPTAIPTSIPTGIPSAVPTVIDQNVFYSFVNLEFSSQIILLPGTVISVTIPQLTSRLIGYENVTVFDAVTSYDLHEYYLASWDDDNQMLSLTIVSDVMPGNIKLTVQSPFLELKRVLLYENDVSLSYEISHFNRVVLSQKFDYVSPIGLMDASLSLGGTIAGGLGAVDILVVPIAPFTMNSSVVITLPGFSGLETSLVYVQANETLCPNIAAMTWDNVSSTITISFKHVIQNFHVFLCERIDISISESNGLRSSASGSNNATKTPTLTLYDINLLTLLGPSSFNSFTPIVGMWDINVEFVSIGNGTVVSGNAVPVEVSFSVANVVSQGDKFELFLPQFWSTVESVFIGTCVNSSQVHSTYAGVWKGCSDTLVFTALEDSATLSHCISITGLRIPRFGVSLEKVDVMSVSATMAAGMVPRTVVDSVQLVGHLLSSSISYSNATLSSEVGLVLSFHLSTPLYVGETVVVSLPNFVVNSAVSILGSYSRGVALRAFVASWDSSMGELTLTVIQDIPATTPFDLTLGHTSENDGFLLPPVGLYTKDSVDYVISTNAREGRLDKAIIESVQPVGIMQADVNYNIFDLSAPVEIHIHLQFSETLIAGDEITILAPCLTGYSNDSLLVIGGSNQNFFESAAIVSFDNSTKEMKLSFTGGVSAKSDVDIFVQASNMLQIVEAGTFNQTHYASGSTAQTGTFSAKQIDHFPSNVIGIIASGEPDLECSVVGLDYRQNCTLHVEFDLQTSIDDTAIIAFSHKNLMLRDEREFELQGSVTSQFVSFWRPADSTLEVKPTSNLLFSRDGYLYADEAYDYHTVENVLPSASNGITVLTDIPHVTEVYSNSRDDLLCGDAIIIAVKFSECVMFDSSISDPISLFDVKLLLNTHEYAMYVGGNATDTFEFLYHVDDPVNVTDLGPLGPNALEFGETDIYRVGQRNVILDPTVPKPYGSLLHSSSDENFAISVTCNSAVAVENVDICRKPFSNIPQYLQPGDVLDICVTYERPIVVVGSEGPTFHFQGSSAERGELTGSYVNVSSEQWLYVKGDAESSFALYYEGSFTDCISWSNVTGLYDELAGIDELELSFPLVIDSFPTSGGFTHRLRFDGVAPVVLVAPSLMCAREASARIQLPEYLLRTLTFRRTILYGDNFEGMRMYGNDTYAIRVPDATEINVVTYTPGVSEPSHLLAVDNGEEGSLSNNTAGIIIFTGVSQVHRVYSNFSRVGLAGDVVHIVVVFDSPVEVVGTPYLEVDIHGTPRECSLCDITQEERNVIYGYSSKEVCFAYVVQQNDTSKPLGEFSTNSLVLNGGSILSKSIMSSLPVNTTLPLLSSPLSLSFSNITVNAIEAPRLHKVYTDVGPGEYGAGHEIYVSLEFYSPVTMVKRNTTSGNITEDIISPFIRLNTTADTFYWAEGKKQDIVSGQPMNYSTGSGTNILTFLYVVKPDDFSKALGFQYPTAGDGCVLLEGDFMFEDILGNTWSTITDCTFEDLLRDIIIDTTIPHVWRVTSDTPDGKYYPGNVIDVTVLFTKPVVIVQDPKSDTFDNPQIELIVPHQKKKDLLANYVSGNGTEEIHFSYVVPKPQLEIFYHPKIFLEPAGTASLFQHLNGAEFRRLSTHPFTVANPFVPAEDDCYLRSQRAVHMIFEVPRVIHVVAVNASGTYTAGDTIVLDIYFSQPVMCFFPPVFRLDTGDIHRSATYLSGNNSDHFYYSYVIQEGDSSDKLDYIDTRREPYSTNLPVSYALKTDIIPGASGRLTAEEEGGWERYNDIVIYPYEIFGGIFRQSEAILVPADVTLPLPGLSGSLSAMSAIHVDTSPPNVTKIYTTIPNGSYGPGINIPIIVRFNQDVCVDGLPKILFYISGDDKYAEYVNVTNGNELIFSYTIETSDQMDLFDYKHRDSFIYPVTLDPSRLEDFEELDGLVTRLSQQPTVLANTTLAWVSYVESVISSTSISGSGHNIRLSGNTNTLPVDISLNDMDSRTYSVGDVIDITVKFSNPVSFLDDESVLVLNTNTPAHYVKQIDDLSVLFRLTIQYDDAVPELTYPDVFALRTSTSCSILTTDGPIECAAQNLPSPRGTSTNEDRTDSLSGVGTVILQKNTISTNFLMKALSFHDYDTTSKNAPWARNDVPKSLTFETSASILSTGEMIQVQVPFSDAIIVEGKPVLVLYVNSYIPFHLNFVGYANSKTIIFETVVSNDFKDQKLECASHSEIILNGGGIYYQTNFIRMQSVDLQLGAVCCRDQCEFSARFEDVSPTVSRVYSSLSGTFFAPDEIEIFIEYTRDVVVIGSPVISLNLDGDKFAVFKGMANSNTLFFGYVCQSDDSSAGLDYISTDAFHFPDGSFLDGIYMDNVHSSVLVDSTLPEVGEAGSLGRENTVVIDATRAANTGVIMTPLSSTAGEVMILAYSYNRDIVVEVEQSVASPSLESFYLTFEMTSNALGTTESYRAIYSHFVDETVYFTFPVTKDHLSGPVSINSVLPMTTGDFKIVDKQTGALAGLRMLSSLVSVEIGNIDNDTPYVLEVTSPNITDGLPWGIGDIIQIDVIMSSPVAIVDIPVLRLALAEDSFSVAEFDPYLGMDACYTSVRFKFIIVEGTAAYPLEYTMYEGEDPLTGDLRRCVEGAEPTISADLTLAFPFTKGSLGYCCPVNIDSAAPYIKYVMPMKRAGLYGFNEEIAIMVRFSKPVVVVGYPMLELDVGTGVAYANYTSSFYERELLIDILDTDIFFIYKIGLEDETADLHHFGINSMILNGSSILLASQNPILSADVTLRDPLDHELSNDVIEQQWKFGYPAKVEVLLRDMYHTDPVQLTVRLEHGPKAVDLFDACCKNGAIGKTAPLSRLGNNATVLDKDTGIGTDLFFSDTRAKNIALSGVVNQSSTAFGSFPTRAIDGGNSPFFGDLSVTETSNGDNEAWWQIHVAGSNVQSINIWPRTPQQWIPATASVTIKAWDKFPAGKFRLQFSGVLDENGIENPVTTGYINMGATASDVAKRIHEHGSLRQLKVTRQTIYGDGVEKGHGHKYLITFFRVEIAEPIINVVDTAFVGGTDVIEGQNVENIRNYQLATTTKVESRGQARQVDRVAEFVGGVDGLNSWLLPYWVMIFEETGSLPPVGLEDSKEKAVWKREFTSIGKLEQIVFSEPLANVGYVKIQREGIGSLSLAEVEIYEHRLNTLHWYKEGFPVTPTPVTKPFQPRDSFHNAFKSVKYEGQWSVQFSTTSEITSGNIRGWEGSEGTVSDWVLVVTDLAGITHTHYQDLRAEITAMPKYGQLITTTTGTTSPYSEWRDAFELTENGYIEVSADMKRALGICNGVDTTGMNGVRSGYNTYRYCPDSFGVGHTLNNRLSGDYPNKNQFLRNERAVFYIPNTDYRGPDFFTYKIFEGPKIQKSSATTDNEVTVHVRKCRDNQATRVTEGIHSLCSCSASEDYVVGDWTTCHASIQSICAKDSIFFDSFFNLCLQCGDVSTDSIRDVNAGCRSEIIRTVSYLVASRQCDTDPYYTCGDEIVTERGRESVNYLSLSKYPWNSPFQPMRQYAGDIN